MRHTNPKRERGLLDRIEIPHTVTQSREHGTWHPNEKSREHSKAEAAENPSTASCTIRAKSGRLSEGYIFFFFFAFFAFFAPFFAAFFLATVNLLTEPNL
jgi:quinol-cytochrome oxidoreductase complex cytochrome b subunit